MEDFTKELERASMRVWDREINGHSYRIQASDPHGLWQIYVKTGKLPAALEGFYTSTHSAWKAIETYEASRPKPIPHTILSTDGKGGKKRIPVPPKE